MVLLGRRSQGFGEHRVRRDAQRQLPPPGGERNAVDADQITEVEAEQALEALLPELVDARLKLDPAGAVDQVQEGHAALAAPGAKPAGDPVRTGGLIAGLEPAVRIAHRHDRLDPFEAVWERIDACGPQRLELRPPRREKLVAGQAPALLFRRDV